MDDNLEKSEDLLRFFREREKELECLYLIEGILKEPGTDLEKVYTGIIDAIPSGWQYPEICQAKICVGSEKYHTPGLIETSWRQRAKIAVNGKNIGEISIYYSKEMPEKDDGPFIRQEKRLLETIADRLGSFIHQQKMHQAFQGSTGNEEQNGLVEWRVIFNLLRRTDKKLFIDISQKMLIHLCWNGISAAEELRDELIRGGSDMSTTASTEDNMPHQRRALKISEDISDRIFQIAANYYTGEQIQEFLQEWIQDDKLKFMVHVTSRNTSLPEVIDAIRKYAHVAQEGIVLSPANRVGVCVALIRRIFSSQLNYINIAKNFIHIEDYFDLIDRTIYTAESQGRLGGKCAGLFLAKKILKKSADSNDLLREIKIPKSWYITSDVIHAFLRHNNLDDVVEQKYKDIDQVRLEYPNVVQTLKNCHFPPEIVHGLSMLLDEFEDKPLVIRSSSLLEDSFGAAFSGKYKSLFLANQGSKQERLDSLMDAIAEVYASTFGPDPIEYRTERGLIDFSEEMGIMIQEVVGTRVGDYFLPAFAGVAFSKNEFRWSPRIKHDDGLIRLVPGLGTRAVDRTSDDYPILIAPGQPGLRVNITPEEIAYYSPKKADVINLKTNTLETIDMKDLLRMHGDEMPLIDKIASVYDGHHLRRPMAMNVDFEKDELAVTFEGLINDATFVKQVKGVLDLLEKTLDTPVDIEFAHDGKNFYLLQCRPQSYAEDSAPAPIPKDTPEEDIVFSANRYISNGRVPDITHIVYVDPQKYSELPDKDSLNKVGRAVGALNKLLPKRQFILMGPGRWGSRGDIKLGVNVTYSDINNTAVLIEIARKKGNYMPDLSFGTHFFQDLVEARIRYLPLYPDDKDIIFNERFLMRSTNILAEVVPEFASLADTVRLIDIPETTGGQVLQILMNADLNEALGILTDPASAGEAIEHELVSLYEPHAENFWLWRQEMARLVASQVDPARFGVEGFYVFGSTKNASAGMGSDIDILIHFRGSDEQRGELLLWLEGWSLCLDEINYIKTGYRAGGLIDIHIVTDQDIEDETSYAIKIGAVTDAALRLPMKDGR
jgi:hypothetical protein